MVVLTATMKDFLQEVVFSFFYFIDFFP